MESNKPFNMHSRLKSFAFALQGIITFFKTQHNAWIHALAGILVCSMGMYWGLTAAEWCFIAFAIGLVFISEMLNTSIEFLTDLVSPQFHPLAKKVKDVAAGAVLFASLIAIAIGCFVFIPKLL